MSVAIPLNMGRARVGLEQLAPEGGTSLGLGPVSVLFPDLPRIKEVLLCLPQGVVIRNKGCKLLSVQCEFCFPHVTWKRRAAKGGEGLYLLSTYT